MVRVMSEVKCSTCKGVGRLEFEQGQRRVPCVACSGSGLDWRKTCDAQRLRADTAEAEASGLRLQLGGMEIDLDECDGERHRLRDKLAAAEQRATELAAGVQASVEVIRGLHDQIEELKQRNTAAEQRIEEITALLQRVVDSSVLSFEADAPEELESLEADICAALNQKSEGESQ